jgi:3-dehydroquinate synthase
MRTIDISLKENAYKVFLGSKNFSQLFDYTAKQNLNKNVFAVIDKNVINLHKDKLQKAFTKFSGKFHFIVIDPNEADKSFLTLQKIFTGLLKNNYTRDTLMIAIGGGIVGDITGFAASIFARGVQYIQVPTTLLAAVDSSVGGKTGINFHDTKNIIGTFYQPKFVLIDTDFFNTLPNEEIVCGMGEIVKYAYLTDENFFSFVKNNVEKIKELDKSIIERVILSSIKFKANVVVEDEKESNLRKILNLGHTFAHAIEVEQKHKIKHGEAVIIGIACSLFLSNTLSLLADEKMAELLSLLIDFNKFISLTEYDKNEIYKNMFRDKKASSDVVKFVLLKDIGNIVIDVEADKKQVNYSIENGIGLFTKTHI